MAAIAARHGIRRALVAVLLAAAALVAAGTPAAAGSAPPTEFLDLPVTAVVDSNDDYVAFLVDEFRLGTDLDGDGFLLGRVLHTLGPGGVVRNHGIRDGELSGRFLLHRVVELLAGTDLNGDGDTDDAVLAVNDLAAGTGYVTALATRATDLAELVVGDAIVLPVAEADQGRQDLDGDGDAVDQVLHRVDLPTGAAANLGIQWRTVATAAGYMVVTVDEGLAGFDLNGDGDQFDAVAHILDVPTGALTNLAVAASVGWASGDTAALPVEERDQRQDLNGDGDRDDRVLHLYDPGAGLRSTGLTVPGFEPDVVPLPGGDVALGVGEADQGSDLNGDADTEDRVVHVVRADGTIANTGRSGFRLVAVGTEVGFFGIEAADGVDRNGDGDTADLVPQVFSPATGALLDSGLAVRQPSPRYRVAWAFSSTTVAVAASEAATGADLNGDGDTADSVVHLLDRAGGPTVNTGRALGFGRGLVAADDYTAFTGSETDNGADLNGDGDRRDHIGLVWPAGGAELNLGYEMTPFEERPDGALMHIAEETALLDLNGDGAAWPLLAFASFANSPPVADAGPDQVVGAIARATDVMLDGSASTDPDGDRLTFTWTGGFAGGTATGPVPTVTFTGLGSYDVTLTVSDGELFDEDTVTIDLVDTTPPAARAALVPARWMGYRFGRYTVEFSCSDSFDAAPVATAEIAGQPVTPGEEVWLMRHKRFSAERLGHGRLFVKGPDLDLVVTCADSSGNSTIATATPQFRQRRGRR